MITTAVFPVAGLGTRFLPITKTGPKEMLAIVDKPIIHYAVQEAITAGIKHLVFITSSEKRSIEDYFDRNMALEIWLEQQGKSKALATVRNIIPDDIRMSYVRQPMPLGLGHAISCAEHVIGDQPFAVLLPDDIIDSPGKGCLAAMIDTYADKNSSVIAVATVAESAVNRYGIVAITKNNEITRIVEKPDIHQAPSRLAVIGRYILTPTIFKYLAKTSQGAGGEIQLTDAIARMLTTNTVLAHQLQGRRFDCGDKLEMVKATLAYAMKNPDMRVALKEFMRQLLG